MAVSMASEEAEDPAVTMMVDLISGVKIAFDRDPAAPQSAENMLCRYAEALYPIASFVSQLPGLGPRYGNHLAELASALKDRSEGRGAPLFDVKRTAELSSQEVRARANVVLAVEAIKKAGRSFHDEYFKINSFEAAAKELLREFKALKKKWISKDEATIKQWRTQFSRSARQEDEATELLRATRAYILTITKIERLAGQGCGRDAIERQLGCRSAVIQTVLEQNAVAPRGALLQVARRCGKAALNNFEWISGRAAPGPAL
jgi:hypothetical protein